jgi:hypothetical protein
MQFGSRTWLTTSCVLVQEIHGLDLDEDEPSAAMAEEDSAPAAEESAPVPQAETEAPAVEATLPEAALSKVSTLRKHSLAQGVVVAVEGD